MGFNNSPSQGTDDYPSFSTPMQRGTSPLECWYSGIMNQTAYGTSGAIATAVLRAYPVVIGRAGLVDRIAFETTVSAGAGGKARAGIYRATSKYNIYPSELVVDGGEYLTDAVAGIKSTTISTFLPAGLYWFAFLMGTAAPTLRAPTSGAFCSPINGCPNTIGSQGNIGMVIAQAYGNLPTTFPGAASLSSGLFCLIHIRLAS